MARFSKIASWTRKLNELIIYKKSSLPEGADAVLILSSKKYLLFTECAGIVERLGSSKTLWIFWPKCYRSIQQPAIKPQLIHTIMPESRTKKYMYWNYKPVYHWCCYCSRYSEFSCLSETANIESDQKEFFIRPVWLVNYRSPNTPR